MGIVLTFLMGMVVGVAAEVILAGLAAANKRGGS